MKIFWASDSISHGTGYGVTSNYICRRMAEDGHEVYNYAPGFAYGSPPVQVAKNLFILPSAYGDDRWGNNTLPALLNEFKPDLVITWLDCQGMGSYGWSEIPVYMWTPVDTWPVPQQEVSILNRARKLMVPSLWGQEVLAKQDIQAEYIPCGIDLDLYNIDPEGRARWRKQLQPKIDDDTFLIGSVGLNVGSPDRKGYGFEFDAIRQFKDKHPDWKFRVYIHTNAQGDGGAINLYTLRKELGLEDTICFSRPPSSLGETQVYLRDMYNAFDVLLHCGMCEGFGMPLIEAQACGTSIVFNDCTSMSELVEAGYNATPLADMIVSTSTRISLPSVENIIQELETAYLDWKNKDQDREYIRETVQRFDQATIYEQKWRPLLSEVPAPFKFQDAGPRKLMLAAGADKKEGFVHHDRTLLFPHHDVAHDLNVFPWPWDNDSWDYVEFSDCLEHLRASFLEVMDELWRITAPGGHVFIHTAEVGTWQLMMDPTHVRGFMLDSMDYLDPEKQRGQVYSYSDRKWKVEVKTEDIAGLVFVLQPRKEAKV